MYKKKRSAYPKQKYPDFSKVSAPQNPAVEWMLTNLRNAKVTKETTATPKEIAAAEARLLEE